MYRYAGSSQVELGKPIQNMQLQFNSPNGKVVIQVHGGGQSGIEAAKIRNDQLVKQREEDSTVQDFKQTTVNRLHAWQKAQRSGVTFSLSKDIDPSTHSEIHQSQEDDDCSQVSACQTARNRLLRFTKGRKSFRISNLSPRGDVSYGDLDAEHSVLNTSVDSSFCDLHAVLEKQRHAHKIAELRKKEMTFERLNARRQRAIHSHSKELKKQSELLSKSALKSREDKCLIDVHAKVEQERLQKKMETERKERKQKEQHGTSKKRREESLRFINALQHRLQVMVKNRNGNITLPALCGCHPLATDEGTKPPWERCANNCIYYKNPHGYAKALADLFRSLDL